MEDKDFWLDIERQIEKELEACRNCAYNDCGSCSCYERHSIECPYAEEEEGDFDHVKEINVKFKED